MTWKYSSNALSSIRRRTLTSIWTRRRHFLHGERIQAELSEQHHKETTEIRFVTVSAFWKNTNSFVCSSTMKRRNRTILPPDWAMHAWVMTILPSFWTDLIILLQQFVIINPAASSIPPNEGFLLFSELHKARQCFVMESELHAVYLVTPFSVCYQIQEIDWLSYLDMWEKLSNSMRHVGTLVGVKESFLVKAMRGGSSLDNRTLQIHKR